MTDRFTWKTFTGERKEGDLRETMQAAKARIVPTAGPFTLTQDGHVLREDQPRKVILPALEWRLKQGDVGPVYKVEKANGKVCFVVREIERVEIVNISGNDKADLYYSTILDQFRQYRPRYAGSYVCKYVAGSWNLSQHSYGNAVDFFFDTLDHQRVAFEWVIAHADELSIEHAISERTIWIRGVGKHSYTGEFHSHLHADFYPNYTGPCGVRG